MTGKGSKQLTLDYFAGQLLELKNDVQDGRADPVQPLRHFIEDFATIHEASKATGAGLDDLVSTFSILCDLVECKVQTFKSMVLAFDPNGVKQFLQEGVDFDTLVASTTWRHPFELHTMSNAFIDKVASALGRTRVPQEACIVNDDWDGVAPCLDLAIPEETFTRELGRAIAALQAVHGRRVPLHQFLDLLATKLAVERVKAFVFTLHMVQDGTVSVSDGGDGDVMIALAAGGEGT